MAMRTPKDGASGQVQTYAPAAVQHTLHLKDSLYLGL
jgi:hypothetical protein